MKEFKGAHSLKDVQSFIDAHPLAFLYIYRESCSVCQAVKPRVEEMLEDFPMIASLQISVDEVPEAAGEYTVFTAPALLMYVDGKEWFREVRFVVMDDLRGQFKRITEQYDGKGY